MSNPDSPRTVAATRRLPGLGAALLGLCTLAATAAATAQAIDGRRTSGDFELSASVNRYAHQRELDFTPFRTRMAAMSTARFNAIDAAVARKPIAQATTAARLLRVNAQELTIYYLKKIEAQNTYYRAVFELNPHALEEARAIDRRTPSSSGLRLTVALVKGNIGVAGMHNDAGSAALGDVVAALDSPVVARLKAADVVVLGRATLSEFANYVQPPPGFSAQGGQTLSPFGPLTRTAGSSSSGSGAALPLGLTSFTLATETQGSIIYPAQLYGVAALRPDTNEWPLQGVVPFDERLDSVGAFAYSATDLTTIQHAVTGASTASAAAARVVFMDGNTSAFAIEARRLLAAAGIAVVEPDAALLDAWNNAQIGNPGRTCAFVDSMNRYLAGSTHAVRSVRELADWYLAHPAQAPYGTTKIVEAANDTTGNIECTRRHDDGAARMARVTTELTRLGATLMATQGNNGSSVTLAGGARATVPITVSGADFGMLTLNAADRGRTRQMLATLRAIEAVRSINPNTVPLNQQP